MSAPTRRPTLRIGLLSSDETNAAHVAEYAARAGDTVIADAKLDALQKSGVDAVLYDPDRLKIFGEPLALVVPGAARGRPVAAPRTWAVTCAAPTGS